MKRVLRTMVVVTWYFRGMPHTQEVLDKYSIDPIQYESIVGRLEEELSFGNCGLCI